MPWAGLRLWFEVEQTGRASSGPHGGVIEDGPVNALAHA